MTEYDNTNRGMLFTNNYKESDKHPDWKGKLNVGGKDFDLAGWKKTDKNGNPFISLSISEPYVKDEPKHDDIQIDDEDLDKPIDMSEIPF